MNSNLNELLLLHGKHSHCMYWYLHTALLPMFVIVIEPGKAQGMGVRA
jgi:hypothetical protein